MLEYPENSLRVKILKQMIDRSELLPLIEELESKYKGNPKGHKLARIELSRHLKVQVTRMRDTISDKSQN
jgi:hypothetical protein